MRNVYILSSLVFFLLLFCNPTFATHGVGAEITYSCIGPGQYTVELTFYRDCDGISAPGDVSVAYSSSTCGVNSSITLGQIVSGVDVTPLCPSQTSSCNGSGPFGIQQYVYSGTMNLPPGCGSDWMLSWELCCRNGAITTGAASDNMYVSTNLDNTLNPCNSSPQFTNTPTPVVCVNQPVIYNHGVVDPDGDSLAFSLINCLQSSGGSVGYNGGLSGTNPLLTSGGVNINPITGAVTFTPNAVQVGVICVRAEEYRNGVKIGEVIRDMQFRVLGCSNPPPVASGFNGTSTYDTLLCIDPNNIATYCFDMPGNDPDGGGVSMQWNNGIPNATFSVTNQSSASPVSSLCWTPTAADVGTHIFTISVEDTDCIIAGTGTYTYTITVQTTPSSVTAGPDVTVCAGDAVNLTATAAGATSFEWYPGGLSGANVTVNPTVTTDYQVVATFPDGCRLIDYTLVTVNPLPSVSVSPQSAFACPNSSNIQLTATAPSATGFNWSTGASTSSITVSPAATTDYWVDVTDANGCVNRDSALVQIAVPTFTACNVVYASPTGSGAGTRTDPASLRDAIGLAACNNTLVKLEQGIYTIDSAITNVTSELTIEGGFTAGFASKISTKDATIIRRSANNPEGPNNRSLVAFIINGQSNFRFQDLTIQTENAIGGGISTYGVHMTNCSDYFFVRVAIEPGSASNGTAGIDGADGLPGATGGTGEQADGCNGCGAINPLCSSSPATIGGTGGTGGGGVGAGVNGTGRNGGGGGTGGNGGAEDPTAPTAGNPSGGSATATAITIVGTAGAIGDPGVAGGDGDPGNPGAPGNPGSPGSGGSMSPGVNGGFYVPGTTGTNGTDGTGGSGGSGGGGGGPQGPCSLFNPCDGTNGNAGGGGGGGGQGGQGGTGGGGGGSSYGVVLHNNGANGAFVNCNVKSGAPGQGGLGGDGGDPGAGGMGGPGGTTCCTETGCGGNGGPGGDGGQGGDGGDGLAGESQDIALLSGSSLLLSQILFDLASQPTIEIDNISCTNTDIDVSGPLSDNWILGAGANPAASSGQSITYQYTTIGRKTLVYGTNTYTEFWNIILDNTIVAEADVIAPIVDGIPTICAGQTADFTALTGGTNYVYHWDFGTSGNPALVGTQYESVNGLVFNLSGTFDVTLRYETDCCGLSDPDTVQIRVLPNPAIALLGDTDICIGAGGTLIRALGGDAYYWTPSLGLSSSSGDSVLANPPATTTYMVTSYNSDSTCAVTGNITIEVDDLDLSGSAVAATCADNGQAIVTASSGSGNYLYQWPDGQTNDTAVGLGSGNYTVLVSDDITGCVDSLNVFVPSDSANIFPFITNIVQPSCAGVADGTATIDVSGGTGPFGFAWTPSGGSAQTGTGLGAGTTYSVQAIDFATLCSASISLTIPEPDDLTIDSISTTVSGCLPSGVATVFAEGGTSPYTYSWQTTPVQTGASATGLGAGTYIVDVTDDNGCTASRTMLITDNCVLPVEYLYFNAMPMSDYIQLQWETTLEDDNSGFFLERSLDNESYTEIAYIDPAGVGHTYLYDDNNVFPETLYFYRLRQVDINGNFYYSEVKEAILLEDELVRLMKVYPIPATNELFVEIYLSEAGQVDFRMNNPIGQVVGKQSQFLLSGVHTLRISLSDLPQGIYIGTLSLNGQDINGVKFVKE